MRKQDKKPKQRERIAKNFAIEYFDVVQNKSKENRKQKKRQKR